MALDLVTGYKGAAHITAEDVGAFNAGIFGSGEYVLNSGNKFSASLISNNTVKILDGDLMMQGRHITLKKGTYEEVTIENGESGMNRNDLIVARYTKDSITGVENVVFAVIKGTPTTNIATDPEYTTGDILSGGCILHEVPLYRIKLSGLTVGTPEALFKVINNIIRKGAIPFTSIDEDTPETWFSLGDGVWHIPHGTTECINGLPSSYTGILFNHVFQEGAYKRVLQLLICKQGEVVMSRGANASMQWIDYEDLGGYGNINGKKIWRKLSSAWEDQIVQGVYYGNATTTASGETSVSQNIDLGFQPAGVIVARNGVFNENETSFCSACMAVTGFGSMGLDLLTNGFQVATILNTTSNYKRKLNNNGERYSFVAWR